MINLICTPQRADFKVDYNVNNDILTVKIGEIIETFDFTDAPEGVTEINIKSLPVNPILAVEKIGNDTEVIAIRFYGEDEKSIYETQQETSPNQDI